MTTQGHGAPVRLLPIIAGVLLAGGCRSAYPELTKEIDAAVAAARPTAADSAAGAGPRPGAANTTARTGSGGAGGLGGLTPPPAGTPSAPAGTTTGANVATTGTVSGATTGGTAAAAGSTASPGSSTSSFSMPALPPAPGAGMATRLTMVANLPSPEAVVMDTAAGLVIVAGSETVAAGSRGVILRMDPDGTVRDARWIVGGLKGAILRTPRGMAIVADTLWVTDGAQLRGFHRRTGAPVATISLTKFGAVALSDVEPAGSGTLYVTDPAVTYNARGVAQRRGAGRIFQVNERAASVALEHARLVQPTAISWDPIMSRLLISGSASDTIIAWRPGQNAPETVAVGAGPWSGVVSLGSMAFYALNSARGEVHYFQNGVSRRLLEGARGAGDIALDTRRNRLLVPMPAEQRVEIWEVRR